ncbi:MAG: alkaline phosphatase D family protein [Myxococcota bacterium]
MRKTIAALALLAACGGSPAAPPTVPEVTPPAAATPVVTTRPRLNRDQTIDAVAFGSCLDQTKPHPILADIVAAAPDAMVMLGDNVYADASSEAELRRAYDTLAESAQYRAMADAMPILAAWDDHDYGRNDVGKEYELKDVSKTIMLDFFGEPAGSPRRTRDGNYDALVVGPKGQRVQFLLLDTRWFRDELREGKAVSGRYVPHPEPGHTVLGDAQWAWLEARLQEPADVRFLVSSIQLLPNQHGFESWGLFPAERDRLLGMIGSTGAGGVIVVSGDRHRGELSCAFDPRIGYPLLELTATSLNRGNSNPEDNRYRRPGTGPVGDENYGLATIDWTAGEIELGLWGRGNVERVMSRVSLSALQPGQGMSGIPDCQPI